MIIKQVIKKDNQNVLIVFSGFFYEYLMESLNENNAQ